MKDPYLPNESAQAPVRIGAREDRARVAHCVPLEGTHAGAPLLEFWQIAIRRKATIVFTACLGIVAGILLTLPQVPVYQARTTLEIQNLNDNFLNMQDVSPTASGEIATAPEYDLQTQVNILQSESILGKVIDKLGLKRKMLAERAKSPFHVWLQALHPSRPQPEVTTDDVLPMVAKNLKVRMQTNTRLIEILYDSTDPAVAADTANALTEAFIRENLESRWETARKTDEWLTGQMQDVRIKLENSEAQLQDYARGAGLLFTGEKDNVEEDKLRQVQQALSRAQAERIDRQSKYERAKMASADSLPQVLDDPTVKDLQIKLTDLRRQHAQLSATLTPAHPSVLKVDAEVASLEAARDKERANVITRLQNEFESAQRAESLLQATYDNQAREVTEQSAKVTHYEILKREVDNNRQLYDSMLRHVKEAGVASALRASNVRVVDPARRPKSPYKPNLMLNAITGLLSGGFLGLAFVITRARTDRSIRNPGESSSYLAIPELGVIPSARAAVRLGSAYSERPQRGWILAADPRRQKTAVELVTWNGGTSMIADSFRSMMTSIIYAGENGQRLKVIAITSAEPGEGKTTIASNLAQALAEIGRRVLLIDGDMRKPRLHEIFQLPNIRGFSDLLESSAPLGSEYGALHTKFGDLYLLPAGTAGHSISSLLHSARTAELLQGVRNEFDMIVIDTPPMLNMPDARILGRLADEVILVVRSARTAKHSAETARLRLAEDGTRVLGTVLNEWDPRKTAGYAGRSYSYRH